MYLLGQVEDVSVKTFLAILSGASGFTVLSLVTWAWYTGKICTRRELDEAEKRYDEMTAERDKWQQAALHSLTNNERLQGATEEIVKVAKEVVTSPPRSDP